MPLLTEIMSLTEILLEVLINRHLNDSYTQKIKNKILKEFIYDFKLQLVDILNKYDNNETILLETSSESGCELPPVVKRIKLEEKNKVCDNDISLDIPQSPKSSKFFENTTPKNEISESKSTPSESQSFEITPKKSISQNSDPLDLNHPTQMDYSIFVAPVKSENISVNCKDENKNIQNINIKFDEIE